jgi:cell division protein ZapA
VSNVTLSIGGREYKVACAAGEEAHVAGLGRLIDGKLAAMEGMTGQSEARTLLFAALLLADELHEAKSARASDTELAPLLEQFADRIENLAARLEGDGPSA